MIPYLSVCIAAFYALPYIAEYFGGEILLMLVVLPCVCFACSAVYGIRNGFNMYFPLLVGIVFIPAVFVIYNYTAWVYPIAYAAVAFAGSGFGSLFCRR